MTREQLNQIVSAIQTKKETYETQITDLQTNVTELEATITEKDTIITGYEDKWNDVEQLQLRVDELGKIVQTTTGTGTAFDPYKYWTAGTTVHVGEWWQCTDENGYIWEAIKDGVPSSDTDTEYWDVIE